MKGRHRMISMLKVVVFNVDERGSAWDADWLQPHSIVYRPN
jgi:hypothetical protein